MSDTVVSLLSGLIGAIVGGALSLFGSIIVNRMERRTQARMLLYTELIHGMEERIRFGDLSLDEDRDRDRFAAFGRMAAIAGRKERQLGLHVLIAYGKALDAHSKDPGREQLVAEVQKALSDMNDHLRKKLD